MWKKGKNLVYLYKKLSILNIGGARLIFMNSSKCSTKSLIKKGDVVLSGSFAWRYSLSNRDEWIPLFSDIRILEYYEYSDSWIPWIVRYHGYLDNG